MKLREKINSEGVEELDLEYYEKKANKRMTKEFNRIINNFNKQAIKDLKFLDKMWKGFKRGKSEGAK